MNTRRVLILAPTLLVVILLQSYFWVPTYEQQTRGNPRRLIEYITASIGDASLLNPILSTDTASSTIEAMVFEGLIDRDEELRFRGRLATAWEIFEEAFFYIDPGFRLNGQDQAGPTDVVDLLNQARRAPDRFSPELNSSLVNIKEIILLPARTFSVTRREKDANNQNRETDIHLKVAAPARVKLVLKRVDQDLFKNLGRLLGPDFLKSFKAEKYLTADRPLAPDRLKTYAGELLPPGEHNPVLIFYLRPNVKFHDGHVLDAHDVRFTYEAIMDPKNLSPRIADYEPVKAVDVLDPLTIRIVYKRLYSPAIETWQMGILPEHLLNRQALAEEARRLNKDPDAHTLRQSEFNRRPIGCGPFVFREWKSDQYIALARFEDYWEGPPNYNRYVYRIIPDLLTQEMEFYAGTIDSYGVQPHQVDRLQNDPRFQSFSGTSYGYTYIGYNMRRQPFDDVRVRKALGMAIDTEKIIRYVLYGQGERITGPFVKQTDFYDQGIKPLPYDPEGALALLEAAGWKRNPQGWLEKDGRRLQFTLITNSGNDLRKAVLAIAQDSWKQIGIDVSTDLLEWSVFIKERVHKQDFDALILGWRMGIDPDLFQIWHSSQTNPHQLNFVGFKNPAADDLIIKIRQEYNHKKQVEYCHQLHEIIARENPYTFLYVNKWTALLDKRILIRETDSSGQPAYKKIKPTKTENYMFDFNKWIKLPAMPAMVDEG